MQIVLLLDRNACPSGNYCEQCQDVFDGDECAWCRDYRPDYERKLALLEDAGFELDDVIDGFEYYSKSSGSPESRSGEWEIQTEIYIGCESHYTFMYLRKKLDPDKISVVIERDLGMLDIEQVILLGNVITKD